MENVQNEKKYIFGVVLVDIGLNNEPPLKRKKEQARRPAPTDRKRTECYAVTAPSEAEDTEFAYFAMTPRA